jgi:hypothetical protein
MVNAPFVTVTHRGLVNGARCLIDGKTFESTDPALFETHWEDACAHALALVRQQDSGSGEYQQRDLSVQARRNLWKESQCS